MEAEALAGIVDLVDEQVVGDDVGQPGPGCVLARHCLAQLGIELVQDADPGHEISQVGIHPSQHLVGQIVVRLPGFD